LAGLEPDGFALVAQIPGERVALLSDALAAGEPVENAVVSKGSVTNLIEGAKPTPADEPWGAARAAPLSKGLGWRWETVYNVPKEALPSGTPSVAMDDGGTLFETVPGLAPLPTAPFIELSGTIGLDDPVDVYQLPIGRDVGRIVLTIQRPAGALLPGVVDHFMLFDATGMMLEQQELGEGTHSLQINLRMPHAGAHEKRGMYIGIGRPANRDALVPLVGKTDLEATLEAYGAQGEDSSEGVDGVTLEDPGSSEAASEFEGDSTDTAPASDYILTVQQFPESTASEGAGNATGGGASMLVSATMPIAAAPVRHSNASVVNDLRPSIGWSRHEVRIPAALIMDSRPRSGSRPVPLRAAEPPGGVLGSDESEDGVDLIDGTIGDVDLLELLMARDGNFTEGEVELTAGESGAVMEAKTRVPIASVNLAAAAPLLGADWPPVGPARIPRPPARPGVVDGATRRAERARGAVREAGQVVEPVEAPSRPPSESEQNPAIACGLGVAYALAVTCLLPDLKRMLATMARRARPLLRRVGLAREGSRSGRSVRSASAHRQSVAPRVT
jgi:hypothetical protein